MSLVELDLALNYALETYIRRDIYFIMTKIYGIKKGEGKGKTKIVIEHPEIEQYIKESYENKVDK